MQATLVEAAPITLSEEQKDLLHERIAFNSLPDSDSSCWSWKGHVGEKGPRIKVSGKWVWVRRVLGAIYLGLELRGPQRLRMSCRNPLCVNYDHVQVVAPAA